MTVPDKSMGLEDAGSVSLENVAESMALVMLAWYAAEPAQKIGKSVVGAWVRAAVKDGASPAVIYQAASNVKHEALKAQVSHQDAMFKTYDPTWWEDESRAGYAMLIMAYCTSHYPEYKEQYKQAREAYIARRAERRLAWHQAGKELKPMEGEQ